MASASMADAAEDANARGAPRRAWAPRRGTSTAWRGNAGAADEPDVDALADLARRDAASRHCRRVRCAGPHRASASAAAIIPARWSPPSGNGYLAIERPLKNVVSTKRILVFQTEARASWKRRRRAPEEGSQRRCREGSVKVAPVRFMECSGFFMECLGVLRSVEDA